MINKITKTLTEVVPFLEADGTKMQMKQFEITNTIEWDNEEEVSKKLYEVHTKDRDLVSKIVPLLQSKDKRLAFLVNQLKTKVSNSDFETIINAAKNIT